MADVYQWTMRLKSILIEFALELLGDCIGDSWQDRTLSDVIFICSWSKGSSFNNLDCATHWAELVFNEIGQNHSSVYSYG